MPNRTRILVAVVVAVALGAAAMLVANRAQAPVPAVASTETQATSAAVPAPALVPAAAIFDAPPGAAPVETANQIRLGARRGAAASIEWERVPMVARVSDLGPLARDVHAGLEAARAQMDSCFEEERRLLARGVQPAYDPEAPPTGPAILVLDLESRAGAIDVVQANVESLGNSLPQLATCAQHVLGGWVIPASNATPGRRWRLKYTLL